MHISRGQHPRRTTVEIYTHSSVQLEECSEQVSSECYYALTRLIDSHIEMGHYEDAARWASCARNAMPGRPEFAVKTAEIYYRAGDVDGFLSVATGLKPMFVGAKLRYWAPILHMGKRLTPDHDLFVTGNIRSVSYSS